MFGKGLTKSLYVYGTIEQTSLFKTPFEPAVRGIPSWYKNIPSTVDGQPLVVIRGVPNTTVKACTPFLDAMTAGYTFFLESDVYVTWNDGFPWINWKGERTFVTTHDLGQTDGLVVPTGHHRQVFKWHNDYILETPKEYSLWFTHPVNRFDLPFTVISGFVDTDKYDSSVQFPFFIRDGWTGVIEKGTPIAQVIPVKRDSWTLVEKAPLNTNELFTRNETYKTRLMRGYKHFFWQKKSYK